MKKKITVFLAVLAALIALSSCSSGDGAADATAQTDSAVAESTAAENGRSAAMRRVADDIAASGLFGDSMELLAKGDDFADELFEFTYGVENADSLHITDFLISEQTSKEAYSFAVAVFGEDFTQSDADAVTAAFREVYADNLASSLKVYNPEAYAMCGEAKIGSATVDAAGDAVHFVFLSICDDNDEALKIATLALSEAYYGG